MGSKSPLLGFRPSSQNQSEAEEGDSNPQFEEFVTSVQTKLKLHELCKLISTLESQSTPSPRLTAEYQKTSYKIWFGPNFHEEEQDVSLVKWRL